MPSKRGYSTSEVEDKVSKYTVRDYSSTKMHINLKTS